MTVETIEVAPEWHGFLHVVSGMEWPDIKEGKVWQASAVLDGVASQISDDLIPGLQGMVWSVQGDYGGVAGQQFADAMATFTDTGPAYLPAGAHQLRMVSQFGSKTATQTQYTKIMVIETLLLLVWE